MESQPQIQIDSLKQRIALFLSCRNLKNLDALSKSDPQVEVYMVDKKMNKKTLIGKTEKINDNLNPDFATFIECDYYFEKEQNLIFMVYDIDDNKGAKDFIGKHETTIGKIFGSPRQTYVADLLGDSTTKSRGKLIVRLDNVSKTNDEARLKLSAVLVPFAVACCQGQNNPYFIISRQRDQSNKDDFVRVYRSQHLENNTKPIYNPVKIKLAQICNGDRDLPIMFSFYSKGDSGIDKFYGEGTTTINKLIGGQKTITLQRKNTSYGEMKIDHFNVVEMPNFMEYLRSGWAINLSLAIDFTASNKELSERDSLHYQHSNGKLNPYEQALLAVGKVVEPYGMNSQFASFGFGGIARFLGSNAISHCFNLNGSPDPVIIGLQNIFLTYKNVIKQTGFAGPTFFTPVLKALLAYVQQCLTYQMYHCMVIITDGDIHDMKETKDIICELSKFPVSLIIIGVGDEDFQKMVELDSDNVILRNSKGQAALRDIVQFVKFQDYTNSDISILAEEVLRELPDQLVQYMMQNNVPVKKQEWMGDQQMKL